MSEAPAGCCGTKRMVVVDTGRVCRTRVRMVSALHTCSDGVRVRGVGVHPTRCDAVGVVRTDITRRETVGVRMRHVGRHPTSCETVRVAMVSADPTGGECVLVVVADARRGHREIVAVVRADEPSGK